MPSASEHDVKYRDNRALLDTGFATVSEPWAAVVAFYAAVHLVERLAATESGGRLHHRSHQERDTYLLGRRHRAAIYNEYSALYDAGYDGRYRTVNLFRSRWSGRVQPYLIDQCLVTIERYVASICNPPPPPQPATGS